MKGMDTQMSRQEALYQSLAACGAALIIFNGICHLFVAVTLFPFGPEFFRGYIIFESLGVVTIVAGILLLGAILRFFTFPVVAVSLVTSVAGVAIMMICQILYDRFNVFALSVVFSGILMAYFFRKATHLRA